MGYIFEAEFQPLAVRVVYQSQAHAVVVDLVLTIHKLGKFFGTDIDSVVPDLLVRPHVELVLGVEGAQDDEWIHDEDLYGEEKQVPNENQEEILQEYDAYVFEGGDVAAAAVLFIMIAHHPHGFLVSQVEVLIIPEQLHPEAVVLAQFVDFVVVVVAHDVNLAVLVGFESLFRNIQVHLFSFDDDTGAAGVWDVVRDFGLRQQMPVIVYRLLVCLAIHFLFGE